MHATRHFIFHKPNQNKAPSAENVKHLRADNAYFPSIMNGTVLRKPCQKHNQKAGSSRTRNAEN
jgi:hypothetical protein